MSNEKHDVIFCYDLWCCLIVTSAALSRHFRCAPFWSYFYFSIKFIARQLRFFALYTLQYLRYHVLCSVFNFWFNFLLLKNENFWAFLELFGMGKPLRMIAAFTGLRKKSGKLEKENHDKTLLDLKSTKNFVRKGSILFHIL